MIRVVVDNPRSEGAKVRTIEVSAPGRDERYPVYCGVGPSAALRDVVRRGDYSSVFVLSDDTVAPLWAAACTEGIDVAATIAIPPGESAKSIDTARDVWRALDRHEADRRSLVVTVGGGVVGDLGGFVAATYQRGIDFAHVPTTLLAQVDASVGGKVGVNFDGRKNRIGAFASPVAVVIDVRTLGTLDARVYRSGFAEMLKHGVIRDRAAFDGLDPGFAADASAAGLVDAIAHSVEVKRAVVERDRLERGERKVLNFGHTIGHAIESLSHETDDPLLHGEAVAIGMVGEARLSALPAADVAWIEARVAAFGLPTRIPAALDADAIVEATRADKKRAAGRVAWTLLEAIGAARIDRTVDEAALRRVIEELR